MNLAPILHLTLWRCTGCGELFQEDDLQQVQPDGHDACPLCEGDPRIIEAECVAVLKPDNRRVRTCTECGSERVASATFPGDVDCLDCSHVGQPKRAPINDMRALLGPETYQRQVELQRARWAEMRRARGAR